MPLKPHPTDPDKFVFFNDYILPKPWVGLTDEDIHELRRAGAHSVSDKDFRAIEARLKAKNNG
jgi:hypothetical protein